MESGGCCPSSPLGDFTTLNFDAILEGLEGLAIKHAGEYFRINPVCVDSDCILDEGDVNLEKRKVIETYKILIFPDKTLSLYFESLNVDELKKEFRRIAMLIHPDKNNHPNAKMAFQKLYNNFVAALGRNN